MVERKVVTVLFCDLVGFTAASEFADPEDVRSRVLPFHRMLRSRLEAFGGTIDKFFGDGVMAVFGAPVAHEDDPVRAIRAGLAIIAGVAELNASDPRLELAVRVGIDTGEVVVAVGARADVGEELVLGDVVNTASRIESATPVGAVVVGATTYAATRERLRFEALEPVAAKGKSAPLRLWRALGQPTIETHATGNPVFASPMVGRTGELAELRSLLHRAIATCDVQVVTIVGEPGIGKSRLVAELAADVGRMADVTWLVGRCLPFGEDVAFWALGEIVRAQAGIVGGDRPTDAIAKLDRAVAFGPDARWVRATLLPLIGVVDEGHRPRAASQEELFSAGSRFLELVTATGPAVVVVEDLHWADDALLGFLEHALTMIRGVPLLIVLTTRQDIDAARLAKVFARRTATTISVRGLADADLAKLISSLLGGKLLPAETMSLVLRRAGGNPLFAVECVRVLRDLDLLDGRGRLTTTDVPFSSGVAALIAARLDNLAPLDKRVLADASVFGQVFRSQAVAAIGELEQDDVDDAIRELARRDLVQVDTNSSDDVALQFSHALVRDVAYASIPRIDRARKHLAAARWLEQDRSGRVHDSAAILAHHASEALDLASAAGDRRLAERIVPTARRSALLAAGMIAALDATTAIRHIERALAITPRNHPEYADVLAAWGRLRLHTTSPREAADALQRAISIYRNRRDARGLGVASRTLAEALWDAGDAGYDDALQSSIAALEASPCAELVDSLSFHAMALGAHGYAREAVDAADHAISVAEGIGLSATVAVGVRALGLCELGDPTSLDEADVVMSRYIEEGRDPTAIPFWYGNRAGVQQLLGGPAAAIATAVKGETLARGRGMIHVAQSLRTNTVHALFDAGRLGDAVRQASAILPDLEAIGAVRNETEVRCTRGMAVAELGGSVRDDVQHVLANLGSLWFLETAAAIAALTAPYARSVGDEVESRRILEELAARVESHPTTAGYARLAPMLVRVAISVGEPEIGRRLGSVEPVLPGWRYARWTSDALLAEVAGDLPTAIAAFTTVAARWEEFGSRLEQAHALLGLGRVQYRSGLDGSSAVARARALFVAIGARPQVAECDRLPVTASDGSVKIGITGP